MEKFFKIYSIVFMMYMLISTLYGIINKERKVDRIASAVATVLLVPVFYYIIKF